MISFVGAGPGAPDLITLRGAARLNAADIVIWASSLVPEAVLEHASREATIRARRASRFPRLYRRATSAVFQPPTAITSSMVNPAAARSVAALFRQ